MIGRNSWQLLEGGLCVLLVMAGCATGPATLSLAPITPQRVSKPTGATIPTVTIAPLEDHRPQGNSLGNVGGRLFEANEPAKWIELELRALSSSRFVCAGAEIDAVSTLTLRPRLLKAYVNSLDVAKTAVVVVEIDYVRNDAAPETRVYRGQLTGANWASTKGEVENALRTALKRCLAQVQRDIETQLATASETNEE